MQQIWESFEIANPFLLHDNEDAAITILALSPPPKRKPKRKELPMTAIPTRNENQSTVSSKPKVGLLPVANVSLTAPIAQKKVNSLLLGSNTRFVGSHFNTRLTNVGSLFRQVYRSRCGEEEFFNGQADSKESKGARGYSSGSSLQNEAFAGRFSCLVAASFVGIVPCLFAPLSSIHGSGYATCSC